MNCDLCGSGDEQFFLVEIEGVNMTVCSKCKGFGKLIKPAVKKVHDEPAKPVKRRVGDAPEETVREDFAVALKAAREKLGLKQEEVGKRINEKVSVIHSLESGHFTPSISLARKLEKFYHISLVGVVKKDKVALPGTESIQLTIGDLIKVRKK